MRCSLFLLKLLLLLFSLLSSFLEAFLLFVDYGPDSLLIFAVSEGTPLRTYPLDRLKTMDTLELESLEVCRAYFSDLFLEVRYLLVLLDVVVRSNQLLRIDLFLL